MDKGIGRWPLAILVLLVGGFGALAALRQGEASKRAAPHAKVLGLRLPVSVTQIEEYKDGGSVRLVLAGAGGKQASFYFDYSMGSRTRGRLHEGPDPALLGAKLVPPGSGKEQAVLFFLQSFLDSQYSRAQQRDLFRTSAGDASLREGTKGVNARLLLRGMDRLRAANLRGRSQ